MRRLIALSTALLLSQAALADGGTAVELSKLLPPPPAAGSTTAAHDLDVVLQTQKTRTAADMAAAKADTERSVFRFADVLGTAMQPAVLPKTAAFFERVAKLDKSEVKEVKDFWKHPRPEEASSLVHPLAPGKPDDWSYPSGHATFGYTAAVLLANMLPERRVAIFERADTYAQHRIVMGAHFPSDIEAGRIAGTLIAAQLLDDTAIREDFDAARAELRHALGLSIRPPDASRG